MSRARRVLATIGMAAAGVALAAGGAASASAAVSPERGATSTTAGGGTARDGIHGDAYQDSVITAAMAANPGGTRTSASTVVWGDGAAYLSVPTTATGRVDAAVTRCATNYLCYWNHIGYTGVKAGCAGYALTHHQWFCSRGFPWNVRPFASYVNATRYRVWLQQYPSHTRAGLELCIDPYQSNANMERSPYRADRWLWMSSNPTHC
jgi:hypothetical protein